jgi:hypothetical protein
LSDEFANSGASEPVNASANTSSTTSGIANGGKESGIYDER